MQDHGVGEEGVQAHAGGEGDRIVGDQAHDRRADGRGQAGGDEDRALVHARRAEDARVDEQDIGHGQEGGDPGEDLRAHIGVVCVQLEQLFQHDWLPKALRAPFVVPPKSKAHAGWPRMLGGRKKPRMIPACPRCGEFLTGWAAWVSVFLGREWRVAPALQNEKSPPKRASGRAVDQKS
ncbi:hypothetical protein D3C78_1437670 [compost metagenome]